MAENHFYLKNSADPDKMQHYASFHLCPHHLLKACLGVYHIYKRFSVLQYTVISISVLSGIKQVNVELEPGFQSKKRNNGMHPFIGVKVEGKGM